MAKRKPIPSQAELKELLDYDPETGVFRWKLRPGLDDSTGWNTKWAGKIAGRREPRGYVAMSISRIRVYAHRIAWVYVHGHEPPEDIDHIDGNRTNNRIANLRLSSRKENCQNVTKSARNTSGFLGVSFDRRRGTWTAEASGSSNGIRKHYFLGRYKSKEEAAHAAHEWRMKNFLGYTGRGRQPTD